MGFLKYLLEELLVPALVSGGNPVATARVDFSALSSLKVMGLS